MSSLKSGVSRVLRSKAVKQNRTSLSGVTRGITATTKNATPLESTPKLDKPAPILHSHFTVQQPFLNIVNEPSQVRIPPHPRPTPFDDLRNSITQALTDGSRPSLPTLFSILRSYSSDSSHWSEFAHANPEKQYTRNLVCEVPGVFNLLLLVWTPGKASPIHDHADSHCLMKVLRGSIQESRYAIPERPGEQGALIETSNLEFGLNKVTYMADQLGLHSIANPHPSEYAVSLHLYTPPNAALRGCHVYDRENGGARHVMQGVYDSLGGKVIGARK